MPDLADRASRPRSAEPPRVAPWLFWVFGIALLLPVWAGTHFPSEDGLAHLAWTEVYRALGSPEAPWRSYYERAAAWNTPNLAYFALQYTLGAVVDAHTAQRLVLSVLIISWVASVHVLSVQLRGRLTLGAFASLLLVQSSWLYGGYLGFLVGVPPLLLALAVVARLFRSTEPPSPAVFGLLAVLGVLSYYAHLTTAAMFLVLVAITAAYDARRKSLRPDRTTAGLAFAAVPAAVLVLSYLAADSLGAGGMRWESPQKTVARFAGFAFFRGFAAPGAGFWGALAAFAGLVLVLCLDALRALRMGRVPAIGRLVIGAAAVLAVLYAVAPDGVGDGYNLKARFQLVLWAWLLPSLPYALSKRWRTALSTLVAVLLVWQVATFTARARRFDREYDAIVAGAGSLVPGSTIERELAYERAAFEGSFLKVLAHAPEELASHCGCVLVGGYHPSTSFYWVRAREHVAGEPSRGADYRITVHASPEAPIVMDVETVGADGRRAPVPSRTGALRRTPSP